MKKHFLSVSLGLLMALFAQAQAPCAQSIDSRTFGQNLAQMRAIPNDAARLTRALNFAQVYCLHSGQLFDLANIFREDHFKYDVIATAYPNMTDQDNRYMLLDVFSQFSSAFRMHDYMDFIDGQRNRPYRWNPIHFQPVPQPAPVPVPIQPAPVPQCFVSDAEMQEVRASIKGATFDSSMIEQAKMLLKAKQCYSSQQIASIVSLFSFASSQVDVAKFAYDFCIDRDNYFRVINVLGFDSSKREVRDYIGTRQ
ncbi:MAG: DUF4476 domain-containing protein [Flavobacteriales bacterium]|nr:DUF4476 domain-containing protein [Flavobacteriales bacterium]